MKLLCNKNVNYFQGLEYRKPCTHDAIIVPTSTDTSVAEFCFKCLDSVSSCNLIAWRDSESRPELNFQIDMSKLKLSCQLEGYVFTSQ